MLIFCLFMQGQLWRRKVMNSDSRRLTAWLCRYIRHSIFTKLGSIALSWLLFNSDSIFYEPKKTFCRRQTLLCSHHLRPLWKKLRLCLNKQWNIWRRSWLESIYEHLKNGCPAHGFQFPRSQWEKQATEDVIDSLKTGWTSQRRHSRCR